MFCSRVELYQQDDAAALVYQTQIHYKLVVLVVQQTRDRKVADSTHGRGAIKSTRSTQPSIPLG